MRAVIQRVSRASVRSGDEVLGTIGNGMLVLLGVAAGDEEEDAAYIAGKISRLRIFADAEGRMNLSLPQAGGDVLLVSQFTLLADARKGNRPSFSGAADPVNAERLYLDVADRLRREGIRVETGSFGAMMSVELVNEGPVTIILDSREGR